MQLNKQCGFALTEALVALLVLSLGAIGLLWMHQQALVLQRQQHMRAIAMVTAQDLAERMRLNAPQAAMYTKAWGASTSSAALNCASNACSRQNLAQWDMQAVQQNLQQQMPEGDFAVFPLVGVAQWWGILIAWHDGQETYRTDTQSGSPDCPADMSCWRLFFRPD